MKSLHSVRQIGLGLALALGLFISTVDGVRSSSDLAPVTQVTATKLNKEFKKTQAAEFKALEKNQKSELKDLKSSQAAHEKEWEAKEKETRHAFFLANTGGPERRSYVKDFLDRRKVMITVLKEEQLRRIQEKEVKKRALIEDQRGKLKEFEEALAKGEHPSGSLWPR